VAGVTLELSTTEDAEDTEALAFDDPTDAVTQMGNVEIN
jgi:hypothetical protein